MSEVLFFFLVQQYCSDLRVVDVLELSRARGLRVCVCVCVCLCVCVCVLVCAR